MNLLNLCCGSVRPQSEEWTNLDLLLPVVGRHSAEWKNLQEEKNYLEHDVTSGKLPFAQDTFDGILFAHALEHFDCQQAVKIMAECRRVLKTGGLLLVSVPDASYFRRVHDEDTVENAERLFGEPIHLPDGETTFFGYGLWNRWHKAILTEDALWCYFVRSGFKRAWKKDFTRDPKPFTDCGCDACKVGLEMAQQLNRLPFSLCMCSVKE